MAIPFQAGFTVLNAEPIDDRITVANEAARLGTDTDSPIFDDGVYRGLLVYQQDTQQLFQYIGPSDQSLGLLVGDNAYWMELTNQGTDQPIVAEGEVDIAGTDIEEGITAVRRPIRRDSSAVPFQVTVESLPTGSSYEITEVTSTNTEWTITTDSQTVRTVCSPDNNFLPSMTTVQITHTVDGGDPIVSDSITLAVYEPIYTFAIDTEPTGHLTVTNQVQVNEVPRIGTNVTLNHTGTGVSYGIINIPASFKGGSPPIFLAGGFSFTPVSYAPPNDNTINSRYTTYVVPIRQDTVVTIN